MDINNGSSAPSGGGQQGGGQQGGGQSGGGQSGGGQASPNSDLVSPGFAGGNIVDGTYYDPTQALPPSASPGGLSPQGNGPSMDLGSVQGMVDTYMRNYPDAQLLDADGNWDARAIRNMVRFLPDMPPTNSDEFNEIVDQLMTILQGIPTGEGTQENADGTFSPAPAGGTGAGFSGSGNSQRGMGSLANRFGYVPQNYQIDIEEQ